VPAGGKEDEMFGRFVDYMVDFLCMVVILAVGVFITLALGM
jgi:hypothetical protein